MLKSLLCSILVLMLAAVSFAEDFQPTVMEIDVPDLVQYDFDGTDVEIPVNIAGTGGAFWLVITTKDQGDQIGQVQNGFLGWHKINGIDTTVYISPKGARSSGSNTFTWDGMCDARNGGGPVSPGSYNYYVYGYDDQNARQLACNYIAGSPPWDGTYIYPIENDENGNPLAQPLMVGTRVWYQCNDEDPKFRTGVHFKWVMGSDPNDEAALQTSRAPIYTDRADIYGENAIMHGPAVFDPSDHDVFYHCALRYGSKTATIIRWAFVNDGNAVQDQEWLGWDGVTWDEKDVEIGAWSCPAACYTDQNNIFISATNTEGTYNASEWNVIRIVSFDGEVLVDEAQIPDYFMPDDPGVQGKVNCQIRDIWARAQDEIIMLPTGCCLHEMVDASPLYDNDDPVVLWGNGNGDFYMDIQWRADDEAPWACLHNAEYEEQRTNSVCVDKNNFTFIDTEYGGLVSGGVSCPDGFSIGMIKWADATVDGAHHKSGTTLIDSGSNYDGYYTGAAAQDLGEDSAWRSYEIPELYFIATDSDAGVISSEVAVDEDDMVAFTVDQNSPNPFNPTTTIGFTIPEAANVAVDVFYIAGKLIRWLTII